MYNMQKYNTNLNVFCITEIRKFLKLVTASLVKCMKMSICMAVTMKKTQSNQALICTLSLREKYQKLALIKQYFLFLSEDRCYHRSTLTDDLTGRVPLTNQRRGEFNRTCSVIARIIVKFMLIR